MITADQRQGQHVDDARPFHWLKLSLLLPLPPFQAKARLRTLLRAVAGYATSSAVEADARAVPLDAHLDDEVVVVSETEAAAADAWEHL
jgi:hypothetical protein